MSEDMDVMGGRRRPVRFHFDASETTFTHIIDERDVARPVIDLDSIRVRETMGVRASVRMVAVTVRDIKGIAMMGRDAIVAVIRRFAMVEPYVPTPFLARSPSPSSDSGET